MPILYTSAWQSSQSLKGCMPMHSFVHTDLCQNDIDNPLVPLVDHATRQQIAWAANLTHRTVAVCCSFSFAISQTKPIIQNKNEITTIKAQ